MHVRGLSMQRLRPDIVVAAAAVGAAGGRPLQMRLRPDRCGDVPWQRSRPEIPADVQRPDAFDRAVDPVSNGSIEPKPARETKSLTPEVRIQLHMGITYA